MSGEVNSKEYWDERFEENWETAGGIEQTRAFVKLMIEHLPKQIIDYFQNNKTTVLDWGCAIGSGVKEFADRFEKSIVTGLDFSDTAIEKSKILYPELDFIAGSLEIRRQNYDVIYSSNCLEHFKDPYPWLQQILSYTNKYAILLVPYDEKLVVDWDEHQFSFTSKSFYPKYRGFEKLSEKIIDECINCWIGKQILVVYKKK